MWKITSIFLASFILCLFTEHKASAQIVNNQDPVVNYLGSCLSNRLQNSKALAPYNQYPLGNPSDLIFRASTNLLTRAGVCDPQLAQLQADAASQAGEVTFKLFFDTVGFTLANFLTSKGLVNADNVDVFCLKLASSIEIDACANGLTGPLSVMNSVAYGLHNVLQPYGVTDSQSMSSLFNLFAKIIVSL